MGGHREANRLKTRPVSAPSPRASVRCGRPTANHGPQSVAADLAAVIAWELRNEGYSNRFGIGPEEHLDPAPHVCFRRATVTLDDSAKPLHPSGVRRGQ